MRIDSLPYILPLAGKGPVPEMFLFVYAPGNFSTIRKPLLAHWLGVIYETVYNCAPIDPRISTMLESVSDPVKLA